MNGVVPRGSTSRRPNDPCIPDLVPIRPGEEKAVELAGDFQGRDESSRRAVMASAAAAGADMALAAAGNLTLDPRKADRAVLFSFIDHPDARVSSAARGSVDFLIGSEFPTTEAALSWWQSESASFDDELSPLD